jgi:hypothetical protein
MSSTTTFIARHNGQIVGTRTSATMAYTHALVLTDGEPGVRSWHLTEDAARKAAASLSHAVVVPVEAHEGSKATVLKRLAKAEQEQPQVTVLQAEEPKKETAKRTPGTSTKAAQRSAAASKGGKAAAKATAGSRGVPTEAANAERQAYLSEVGMDRYRQQYNGGWDAATYGQGVKKAESGTASVAWMDGYTDRIANPGKEGIAAKWSALRSKKAPVTQVKASKNA